MHFFSSNFFLISKSKFDDLLVISSFVGLKSTQAKNSKTNHVTVTTIPFFQKAGFVQEIFASCVINGCRGSSKTKV